MQSSGCGGRGEIFLVQATISQQLTMKVVQAESTPFKAQEETPASSQKNLGFLISLE